MGPGRAVVVLHPAVPSEPWHVAVGRAAAEVARHAVLTVAAVAAGTVALTLVLLLLLLAAPLGAGLLLWLAWRAPPGDREARRLRRRARARARPLASP